MVLTIKRTQIWKSGNSYVVTIPKDFIQHGMLDEGELVDIELNKVEVELAEER